MFQCPKDNHSLVFGLSNSIRQCHNWWSWCNSQTPLKPNAEWWSKTGQSYLTFSWMVQVIKALKPLYMLCRVTELLWTSRKDETATLNSLPMRQWLSSSGTKGHTVTKGCSMAGDHSSMWREISCKSIIQTPKCIGLFVLLWWGGFLSG